MSKLKYPFLAVICLGLLAAGMGLDIYFKPHRDVKTVPVFDEFDVDDFTAEFLEHPDKARDTYLAEDGESKIVAMTGTISAIDTNLAGHIVIELRGKREAGARFTLMPEENGKAADLHVGDQAKITGVVSAGAEFDPDFNRYLDAILEQCYF
jgi:hypothetical protein